MLGEIYERKVTGTMVYYYFVCERKLWYFSNEINMESENESVILGKLLDEGSFKRDENILILMTQLILTLFVNIRNCTK